MNHSRIRATALFAIAEVVASLLGCMYFWSSMLETHAQELQASRDLIQVRAIQLGEAATQQVDATLRSIDSALGYLRLVYLKDRGRFDSAVQDLLATYPKGMLKLITVFDSDGYLIYSSDGTTKRIFMGDREHFLVHAGNELDQVFVSKPIVGRIYNGPLIPLSRPIRDGGRFLGVISIPLIPEYLAEKFSALRVAPEDLLAVVRSDGSFIARNHHLDEALKTVLPPNRPFLLAKPGEHGTFSDLSTVDKVPLLFAWRRMNEWPLSVVVAINEEGELKALKHRQEEERIRALDGMALVLLFSMIAAILLHRVGMKNGELQTSAQALKLSEAQMTASQQLGGTGSWVYDIATNGIRASDQSLTIFGFPAVAKDYPLDDFLACIPERERVRQTLADAINGKRPYEDEFAVDPADGSPSLMVHSVGKLVKDAEGNPVSVLGFIQNVTELRRAEHSLKNSEERLEMALRGGDLGLWDWNISSGAVLYTEHWYSMLGLPQKEGKQDLSSWIDRIHPDDLPNVNVALESHLKGQSPAYESEHRVRHNDGHWLWLLDRGKVTKLDANGVAVRAVGTYMDITERKQAAEELITGRNRYQGILHNMLDAYWRVDNTGRIIEANLAIAKLHGYSIEELLEKSVSDFELVESTEDTRKHIEKVKREGHDLFESKHRCRDGRIVDLEISINISQDDPGNVDAFHRDITERKRAEGKLRLAASVFANSYDGVVITDANNIIVDINPAFSRITGYDREEIIGQTPKILTSERQGIEFYAQMWKSLQEHDFWHGEIWNRRKSGEVYAEMLSISVVRDNADQLQHYIGVFSDISQRKTHEAELHRIAHYDVLTGVPNRRLLADRLGQAIARARRNGKVLAVCYLDLDGFKPINDRYGHAAGDQLLIEITERLKGILRAEDTLARLGGDEFVLLFTDLTQFEESLFVLDRILVAVSTPVMIGDVPISVSASIGVTLFPTDNADADTLLRHADQAMYLAKEAGKNRYHLFDPERDRQVQAHRNYLQRLREALDNSEFVLHYQPKVNLVTGEIIGAEALIRWQHPDQGLLPPGHFLHYMDGNDLEIAVGEWVIDSVLKQIAAWNDLGLNLTVSANVSANHLLQADFADRLVQMLERHPEVASANLELEILETAALANMDQAVHVLTRCRQLGVHLSLDDFGTGYSSLTYFRNLPVDILKIDQSFVRDMLDDPDDLGIVESVIRLAHAFNRPVIAEGVETLDHGAMLVHLECQLAQGYGIARPMPAEQIPGWVSQWRSKEAWLTLDNRLNTREDVMLMVAAQRHRKWIDQIAEHLDHPNDELEISHDSAHCRFGHWYRGSGTARYGQFPEFKAVDPLHETVHVIAAGIEGLARDGQVEAARSLLPELYATSAQLLAQIELLIQKLASEAKG
jgi:diguanylate cyclase (GGDEF)-like protein/PAS domain S-box-containing protein